MGKPSPVLDRRALHQLPDRGRGGGADPGLVRAELRPPGRNQSEVRPGEPVPDESKHLAIGLGATPPTVGAVAVPCAGSDSRTRLGRSRSTGRPEIPWT